MTLELLEFVVGNAPEGPKKCVPFVSEYTDCTDENQCSGCSKCTCTAEGTWSCANVNRCNEMFQSAPVDDNDLDTALLMMDSELKRQRKKKAASSKFPYVPQPTTQNSLLLVERDDYKINIADEIKDLLRPKRSVDSPKDNETIKFYHTVDEVNEDTLKNSNASGTLKVRKLEIDLPKLSRRAGVLFNNNSSNPLHIEYNKADVFKHINDNKIDTSSLQDKNELHEAIGNYSQRHKDNDISKIIVKEMKSGSEIIGDKHAPIMSNVSFTSENETIAAMTYIAGNLLNKLWNMETDSSETIETEVLKHEKIGDLLDLFKEPLTINQELLLKSAVQHLFGAMHNKGIENMSLCQQLGEVKDNLQHSNFSDEKKNNDFNKNKGEAMKVFDNVNNVVNLVKKLEDIQSHLNKLNVSKEKRGSLKEHLETRKDGVFSSNVFGGILELLTKLLLPTENSKKITNSMKTLNIFRKDYDFNSRFKNIFNIALGNITMSTKDKLVLDYLTHIQNNPDCLLHGKRSKTKPQTRPTIESNILLNLSEFFKMKSLNDLLQLVGPKKVNMTEEIVNKNDLYRTSELTTEKFNKISTSTTTNLPRKYSNKLAATKEKLKAHLKTILEDLVEIQNARGVHKNSDIKITDVLPCIYNILNADKQVNGKDKQESADKLSSIFSNLKKELKYASYRRSNLVNERPKSAIVWERLVKNINDKQKLTRRKMDVQPPKTVNELKKIMDKLETGSNTYKNIAILTEIPPADKLTLLKTIDADIKKYITLLENFKSSLEAGIIPNNKNIEFNEFLDNIANNIHINGKIIKKINKSMSKPVINSEIRQPNFNILGYNQAMRQEFTLPRDPVTFNTKITRDQVINQLIKNRINLYIKIKEAEGSDLRADINYDFAKKIQMYLDGGNYELARELYNIFANRQKNFDVVQDPEAVTINVNKYAGRGILVKEPIIQFDDINTRRSSLSNQNHLIQQLINMKNMKI